MSALAGVSVQRRLTAWLVVVALVLFGGVWAVRATASSPATSKAGQAVVLKGKKTVTVLPGMDLLATSKALATAMTASRVGVRSVVVREASDSMKITLTGRAPKPITVAWSVTNETQPGDVSGLSGAVAGLDTRLAAEESALGALQGQVAGHGHNGQYYTKSEADSHYLHGEDDIVLVQSGLDWQLYGTDPMFLDHRITRTFANASGRLVLPINRPQGLGGKTYRLTSLQWCLYSMTAGSKVDFVSIWADPPAAPIVNDQTDRATAGCYTITVPATLQDAAYSMELFTTGGGMFGLSTVHTTWSPEVGSGSGPTRSLGTKRTEANG